MPNPSSDPYDFGNSTLLFDFSRYRRNSELSTNEPGFTNIIESNRIATMSNDPSNIIRSANDNEHSDSATTNEFIDTYANNNMHDYNNSDIDNHIQQARHFATNNITHDSTLASANDTMQSSRVSGINNRRNLNTRRSRPIIQLSPETLEPEIISNNINENRTTPSRSTPSDVFFNPTDMLVTDSILNLSDSDSNNDSINNNDLINISATDDFDTIVDINNDNNNNNSNNNNSDSNNRIPRPSPLRIPRTGALRDDEPLIVISESDSDDLDLNDDEIRELEESLFSDQPSPTVTTKSKRIGDLECPICYESPEYLCAIPCGHLYCRDCISKALAINKSCSICRKKTTSRNIVFLSIATKQRKEIVENNGNDKGKGKRSHDVIS